MSAWSSMTPHEAPMVALSPEVMSCLDKGLTESPVVPLSFSLALARILDEVRRKAGIRYPGRYK